MGAVTKQTPFMIVTEYMVGGSLADLFKGQRFPSMWRAVQLALDMARGLAYLHNRTPHVRCLKLSLTNIVISLHLHDIAERFILSINGLESPWL